MNKIKSYKTLRLVLGDQLNQNHSWYQNRDDSVLYVMMEVGQEQEYAHHHIQKVVAFFMAMENFRDWLNAEGHHCKYIFLDGKKNTHSISGNIKRLLDKGDFEKFEYQLPDEYRLDQELKELCSTLSIETSTIDTEHFLTDRKYVKDFFDKKKSFLMETFYRNMRKQHEILLDQNGEPEGGKWNYDVENREKWNEETKVPSFTKFQQPSEEILERVKSYGAPTLGTMPEKDFYWATSKDEAEMLLEEFVYEKLIHFGTYQDAMHTEQSFMYHSCLSFALNVKILHPKDVVQRVESYWRRSNKGIGLAQVEGFIRQIIGWREYMRGVYWAKMPDYEHKNYFGHKRPLPEFYWTGDTKMKCLSSCITQSLEKAYAHHIQRLMVTGNFALLNLTDPDEVDAWYLGIYIDAVQWVEITNTRGMSQYADGGLLSTKPYISSANYINKMSNYCTNCHYSKSKKTGEKACPFNSLYWNFLMVHEEALSKNRRMSMIYNLLNKKSSEEREALRQQAEYYLEHVNEL